MSLTDKLQEVIQQQEQINAHTPLDADLLKRINYKFRLEWNYTSNSMEGNSLTMQETRSVMVGNITVDGKPIRDVLEMKGHDELVLQILKMGKGEVNISERRIKEIHKAIVHEDDPEKQQFIGAWKTRNNYLTNYKGERFDFVPHADVPDRMHKLVNEFNAKKDKVKHLVDAVALAFWFHLEYITIHPFYDGNGRTARILTNIILIAFGFPPIYIKGDEKEAYYQYLADVQAYGGEPDLFYEFMTDRLLRSQQFVLDAIHGRDIIEVGDFERRLFLIKNNTKIGSEKMLKYDVDTVMGVIENIVTPLINMWENKLKEIDDMFVSRQVCINVNSVLFSSLNFEHLLKVASDKTMYADQQLVASKISKASLAFWGEFTGPRFANSDYSAFAIPTGNIYVDFYEKACKIMVTGTNDTIVKMYGEEMDEMELSGLIGRLCNEILNEIENLIESLKQ